MSDTDRRRGLLLAAVLIGVFVVPLSVSGTAVALSDIASDLGGSSTGQQWALNGFNVTFAASTLVWGALADRIGRLLCFRTGALVFVAGSVVSVLAPNYLLLDAARVLAGIGAGAVFSVGSALLSVVYDSAGRARAFALLGAMAGLVLAFGPSLCGLVTQTAGWRGIFAAQGVLLVVSLLLLGPTRPLLAGEPRVHEPVDRASAVAFAVLIGAVVAGIVAASDSSYLLVGVLVVAAVLSVTVLVRRQRTAVGAGGKPLLDLQLLRSPAFLGVSLVVAVGSFTFASTVTYLPVLVQRVVGMSETGSGVFAMFLTVPTLLMPLLAGVLTGRGIAARRILVVAVVLMVVGAACVAVTAGAALWALAATMVLLGIGFGLHAGLVDNEGLAAAPDEDAGSAAGWINTLRIGTEAIAVSLFGAVFVPSLDAGDPAGAFRLIGLASAVIALVVGVVSVRAMLRRPGEVQSSTHEPVNRRR